MSLSFLLFNALNPDLTRDTRPPNIPTMTNKAIVVTTVSAGLEEDISISFALFVGVLFLVVNVTVHPRRTLVRRRVQPIVSIPTIKSMVVEGSGTTPAPARMDTPGSVSYPHP